MSDADTEQTVFVKSSQVGGTETINNIAAYFIEHDPGPMIMVQPTVEMAKDWSKDRFAPMIRDMPELSALIKEAKSRDSDNTIQQKIFPGGSLVVVGANSPSGLASRPRRIALLDEVSRYPLSAGTEGDPVGLVKARTKNFWNRKIFLCSTPTVEGICRITDAFEESDKRYYHVPCLHCGEYQRLKFKQLNWPDGKPDEAVYVCAECACVITDKDKPMMLRAGKWVATKEFRGIAGFHISELYSPWVTFGKIATDFVNAKRFPEKLQVWVNTCLGEVWKDKGETIKAEVLYARREVYGPTVPEDAWILIAGVDVQKDRIECEVKAFGLEQENWSMAYEVFYGSPAEADVWEQLEDFLEMTYTHALGFEMRIAAAGVDTGGLHTAEAYKFCKKHERRRVYALKGIGGYGRPLVTKPTRSNVEKVNLYGVGVDTAKELIYARLSIKNPGPGYMHFSTDNSLDYFKQLTSEKRVVSIVNGRKVLRWVLKKKQKNNEVLDINNYIFAAYKILNPNIEKIKAHYMQKLQRGQATTIVDPDTPVKRILKKRKRHRKKPNFVTKHRG